MIPTDSQKQFIKLVTQVAAIHDRVQRAMLHQPYYADLSLEVNYNNIDVNEIYASMTMKAAWVEMQEYEEDWNIDVESDPITLYIKSGGARGKFTVEIANSVPVELDYGCVQWVLMEYEDYLIDRLRQTADDIAEAAREGKQDLNDYTYY